MYRRMSTPIRERGDSSRFCREKSGAVPLRDYLRGKVLMSQTASQNSVIFSSPAGITCRTLRPKAFREEAGLHEPALDRVLRATYELLGLISFFTVGPKESRAWTVRRGASAPEAAGKIHTDQPNKKTPNRSGAYCGATHDALKPYLSA